MFGTIIISVMFHYLKETALQNHKFWYDRFFSVESYGEGPTSKFELEDGQTDGAKNGTCKLLWRNGATLQSCKVARAIRNVHDKPESFRARPAIVNVLRLVEFKTIPQPWILDAWHLDAIPAASSPEIFWPFLAVCLKVFLFEFWPRTSTIELSEKKPARSELWFLSAVFLNERIRGILCISWFASIISLSLSSYGICMFFTPAPSSLSLPPQARCRVRRLVKSLAPDWSLNVIHKNTVPMVVAGLLTSGGPHFIRRPTPSQWQKKKKHVVAWAEFGQLDILQARWIGQYVFWSFASVFCRARGQFWALSDKTKGS